MRSLLTEDLNQARVYVKFPSQTRPPVLLCSLFKLYRKEGYWMGFTVSHMLCLSSLDGWAESSIQQWAGLQIRFPIRTVREPAPKLVSFFMVWTQVPSPNRAPGFGLQTVSFCLLNSAQMLMGSFVSRYPARISGWTGMGASLRGGWGYSQLS